MSLFRRWWGPFLPIWHHPAYRVPLVSTEMDPARAENALTWAMEAGITRTADVRYPAEVSWDDAALVHTDAYLAELDRDEVVAGIVGADPGRVSVQALWETWRRATGGTVEAVRHVLTHRGRAANLSGGFHHAEADKGGGFCALNDVAIAVRRARQDGFGGTVVVVDLDAHPPDGIVACLGDDPRLVVRSLSTASHWTVPAAAAAAVTDARVPARTTDVAYLAAVDALLQDLPPADLVLYLAGADPLAGDALGGLAVSEAGLRERDRRVIRAVGRSPLVLLPAGGYHPGSWRVMAGSLAELVELHSPIPPRYDPQERQTRAIMKTLDPGDLGESTDLLITEEELLGSLGLRARGEPRFLGYYTRHGLEHALTAYGYLTILRRLGFAELRVELDVGSGPDRMQVTAAIGPGRATLVDLAASIRTLEGYRVLFVEWLELTDPRAPFTTGRPQLPGQRLPGLGLAQETMQLLVRAAERLELAGIAFTPAHYHVAWMVRERFVVVDPELRGRLRAVQRALSDLPLTEATRIMAGPGVPTEDGGAAKWEPAEMVAPLDPGFAEVLARGEAAAAAADDTWQIRLAR